MSRCTFRLYPHIDLESNNKEITGCAPVHEQAGAIEGADRRNLST